LLHISEIDWKRLETVEEAGIHEGDKIKVKLMEIDPKTGKYKISRRALLEKPEGYVERERRPRPERNDRGERGDYRPRREGDFRPRRDDDRRDNYNRRPRNDDDRYEGGNRRFEHKENVEENNGSNENNEHNAE
jgi:polyribonucleotide nucleotidyltransferase